MRPSPFNAGLMSDFKYQSDQANKPLTPEEQQFVDKHEQMHAEVYADHMADQALEKMAGVELPEPVGGHRANLITFSIRAFKHKLDQRPDWNSLLRKELAYQGIRELSRQALAAGHQCGKTAGTADRIKEFMGNWLNYIEQITQEPKNGR